MGAVNKQANGICHPWPSPPPSSALIDSLFVLFQYQWHHTPLSLCVSLHVYSLSTLVLEGPSLSRSPLLLTKISTFNPSSRRPHHPDPWLVLHTPNHSVRFQPLALSLTHTGKPSVVIICLLNQTRISSRAQLIDLPVSPWTQYSPFSTVGIRETDGRFCPYASAREREKMVWWTRPLPRGWAISQQLGHRSQDDPTWPDKRTAPKKTQKPQAIWKRDIRVPLLMTDFVKCILTCF